ncbi:hypothetical protein [Ktedonospora formicarum]|uniref:Uncharacterized protein n=1 Tax=Ktedonospora formicarum TaxID=2778364 RepID=A0A8J3MR49_9CHLR|nr:hypothetical protein [Ktedonospora formicarum]GHO44665.1 hypothetical protein KSX_28280 [Ktedonospora formicarum]
MSQDSQEYTVSTGRSGRRRRTRTNRPTLVQNDELDQETVTDTEEGETQSESSVALAEAEAPVSEAKPRRSFFSRVGKSEDQATTSKEEATRARLARATHGKGAEEKEKAPAPKTTANARPGTRPASGFKTRWIIGMALYLLVANFAGLYETQAIKNLGLERLVTNFNLFGLSMKLTTSTLTYLVTLVILLVVLARFDLIPRSLTGNTATRGKQTSGRSSSSPATPKAPQQTIRQGVSGESDSLYREYRTTQRRSKKR